MADITKAVEIVFGVVDNTGSGLTSVGAGISNFADQAQNAISPLNALAHGVKLADTAIVALGIAFGGAALNAAGEFNGKVAEIGTLFSGTTEEVDSFRASVEEYASGSTKSLDDITGALYTAVSAGVAWKDAVGFVSTAEKLAVAGQGDLTSSTNVLIGSMNAYGAAAGEAAHYSDVLMQTVLLGQTTLPELAQSLSMVTSTAAAAGISFADVNAAVAALTAAGVPTSQAMTGIQAAMSNIIKPTKEAQEIAASLGLEFNATALKTEGFDGVLKNVYTTTGGNVEVMAKLFGSMEGLKTAMALGADKAGIYAKALDAMETSAGSVDKAFAVLSKQWEAQWQTMSNNFDLFMVKTGSKLLEGGEFAGLITKMTDILKQVNFSIGAGAFDDVFETLRGLAARLGAFMTEIANSLPGALELVDFSKFNGALVNLFNSLGGMFDGVDLTTPKGLAAAIQLVVNSIANLLNQGAGIAQVWGDLFDAALPVVRMFANMSQEAATASGKMLGLGDVANLLLPGLGALGSAIGSVGTGLELLAGASLIKTATGLVGVSTAATALAGTLALWTGGLAAGAAGIGAIVYSLNEWIAASDKLKASQQQGVAIQDRAVSSLDRFAQTTGIVVKSIDEADKLIRTGAVVWSTATNGWVKAGDAMSDLAIANQKSGEEFRKSEIAYRNTSEAMDKTAGSATKLAAGQKDVATYTMQTVPVFDAATGAITGYEQKLVATAGGAITLGGATKDLGANLKTSGGVMTELEKKTNLTNQELIKLAEVTKGAEVKLAELASNERIKTIEAKISLDIANVEANAKVAVAIIEGINTTISTSSQLLSDLFGLLVNPDLGFSDKWNIEDQIDKENNLKREAFELQKELTQAQIAMMVAQTNALNNGEGLITIQADGLEPHLEAFMWKILEKIQFRVNQDGLKLLLGV